MSDKFSWNPGDVVLPQCSLCVHLDRSSAEPVCAAFPGRIPDAILRNEHDHRKPWIDPATGRPGDRGIPLDRSILFEPRSGVAPESLDALNRHFAS